MDDMELRSLSAGEVLDHSFTLFRRLFVPLVLIQVVCSGVPLLLSVFMETRGEPAPVLFIVTYALAFVLGSLASAATAYLISERYLGQSLSAGDALRRAAPRIGAVMVLSLGLGLVVMLAALPSLLAIGAGAAFAGVALQGGGTAPAGGGVALVLVGIALLVLPLLVFSGLSVATTTLVLEHTGAGRAMSRSWYLTKGYRLRIVGLLFVVLIVVLIPMLAIGGLAGAFSAAEPTPAQNAVVAALSGVISVLVTPLLYCVITLLYYDLRVRKEAFDLEVLATTLAT